MNDMILLFDNAKILVIIAIYLLLLDYLLHTLIIEILLDKKKKDYY